MPYPDDPQDPQTPPDPEKGGRQVPGEPSAPEPTGPEVSPEASKEVQRVPPPPPPPAAAPPPKKEEEPKDDEEEGMARMSFLEHLEELRTRLIRIVLGLIVAFFGCMLFMNQLWDWVREPGIFALKSLGYPPELAALTPMEGISIVWMRVPLLASLFIAAPWILYQVWAFIAPGLYKRERRFAAPFILTTAGLFIMGGAFAYFVALRLGLYFLLKIGQGAGIHPYLSADAYMDLFVNVILGVALIFELPVLVFFLTLLRIVTPKFLMQHSRYAILGITVLAAVVTPTPDALNMTLVATPMIVLYFLGVFASFLLVLRREGRAFPWGKVIPPALLIVAILAAIVAALVFGFHLHWIVKWPFLVK
jgi:sec-independent protein translocase protein TatC